MQNWNPARAYAISELDKAFKDVRAFVKGLVNKQKSDTNMILVEQKINGLEMYISTLKALIPQTKGGNKTRKNRRR